MRVGQAGDLLGPADPDGAAEHALHVIGDILQFGAAAGQNDLASDGAGEAEALQRASISLVSSSMRWRMTIISWARVIFIGSAPGSAPICVASIIS